MKKVLLDFDIGTEIDDAIALAYLLAVVPMTNLGLLFAMDPELPELLDGLYLLCGSPTHQRHDVVTESLSAMERDDFIRVLDSRLLGGMTIFREDPAGPHQVAWDVDGDKFFEHLFEVFA